METMPTDGVPFGLPELDDVTGGMRPGHLIVVASAPGAGKTALLLQFLRHAAFRHGRSAHLISLEMTDADIRHRLLSGESRIPMQSLGHPAQKEPGQESPTAALTEAEALLDRDVLTVDARPEFSIAELPLMFYRNRDQILAVDCADLVEADASLTTVARAFKKYALETEMPVIVTARAGTDSPCSPSLTEEADIVLLLGRPDTRDWDHERAGEADISVVKNRMGPITKFTVAHQLFRSRFAPLSES